MLLGRGHESCRVLLEGGSDEEKTICEKIAEMRPRLTRMHKFRSLECEDF